MAKHNPRINRQSYRRIRRNRRIAGTILIILLLALVALILFGVARLVTKDKPADSESSAVSSSVSSEQKKPSSSSKDEASGSSSPEESSSQEEASSSEEESSVPESSAPESSAPDSSSQSVSSQASSKPADPDDPYYESEMPMLVNPWVKMPEGFVPEVTDIGDGYRLEVTAAQAWHDMQAAAWDDGISLWVISAYRTYERQVELYEQKVAEYESYGYSEDEAKEQAGQWVAVPGTSEHSLGLAADLCSLEESFENTDKFAWLQKHCAEYGFILRFPKDKVEKTGISYEPWHYRYVGSNHAKIIMEEGLCLEEYLDKYGK